MTTINLTEKITPDDLVRLEGGDHLYELVDGVLVEKEMSSQAGATTAKSWAICSFSWGITNSARLTTKLALNVFRISRIGFEGLLLRLSRLQGWHRFLIKATSRSPRI